MGVFIAGAKLFIDCIDLLELSQSEYIEKIFELIEKILNIKQRQKIILKAVNELPKKMKEVIVLYEFEQKTYEEISKILNVPIGTVKSRLSCAREILKDDLSELIGE